MSYEALGLWNIGESAYHKRLGTTEAKRIIKASYKKGITTFDSAYSYTDADSILYSALNEIKAERETWRVIEKIMPLPTFEKKALSILKRLHTSYIDILLIHWPSEERTLLPALKELERMKEKGVAKEIGVSNFPLSLLKKTSSDFNITYHERPLSLIWNRDWKEERKLNIKTLAYAPLGFGSLKENKNPEAKELTLLSNKYNRSVSTIALSWVYAKEPDVIIRGVSNREQLDLPHITLDKDDLKALDDLSSKMTSLTKSDNIFSHNWKGGTYEKTQE